MLENLTLPAFTDLVDAQLFVSLHVLVIVVHVVLISVAYLVMAERKISAYIQDRIGPNRTGFDFGLPWLAFLKGFLGLGQPLADGIKFLVKEDYTPLNVDKALFTLGPVLIIIPALIGFAVIPWGGVWVTPEIPIPFLGTLESQEVVVAGANVDVGLIYLLAVASLGVYGVTIGGWASNNKYSFLGGLRATAQMISYEIPLGLSILAVLLIVGSLLPVKIIDWQADNGWMLFAQPIAGVLFFLAILAEANRAPFDNAEAEQELVGGYHTEYSSMRFALYFLAEYAHLVTSTAFFVLLFLGGWQLLPGFDPLPETAEGWAGLLVVMAKFGIFFGKVLLIACFTMVIRWSLPRMRYDQVMQMAWQGVIPLSLSVVVMTSVWVFMGWTNLPALLLGNVVVFAIALAVQPFLPKYSAIHRLPLYGSRFNPISPADVNTAPTNPLALEDRPVQGTASYSTGV